VDQAAGIGGGGSIRSYVTKGFTSMNDAVQTSRLNSKQVDLVAPLFDAYRQFYGKPSDLEDARQFLFERLQRGESVVFAVIENG
jgi:hypothetical protein